MRKDSSSAEILVNRQNFYSSILFCFSFLGSNQSWEFRTRLTFNIHEDAHEKHIYVYAV